MIQANSSVLSLADEIHKRELARLNSKAMVYRKNNNWASDIGECNREMYYSIVDWDKKPLPAPELIARFETGNEQEKKVIINLLSLDFEVVEGQKHFEIKDRKGRVIISGRIDGKIIWQGKKYPFEVKSMNPNIYHNVNTMEDFNKYHWTRKYPKQMQSYLFSENLEEGLFIVTDCLGHFKIIPISINLEEMELIMQRSELVMTAVDIKEPPAFHKDASTCRRCWAFGRVCHPPINVNEMQVITDVEMELKLSRREELKANNSEYEDLDKEIKEYFKGKESAVCGDFMITGKKQIRQFKAKEASTQEIWVTKIEKIIV